MLTYLLFGRERLKSFSVHEQPNPAADRIDRAEALEFVKDGFAFPAFLLPPVWFAARGIWLATLAYLAIVGAIVAITTWLGLPPITPLLAILAAHLVCGAEADEVQRTHLEARGWTTIGHVTGTGPLDCERRFYDHWLPAAPMSTGPRPSAAAAPSSLSRLNLRPQPPAPAQPPPASPTPAPGILGNLLAPLRPRRPD